MRNKVTNEDIIRLQNVITSVNIAINEIRNACEHDFPLYEPYDPDDKWFSSTFAPCTKCGTHGPSGWYCHTSPTKLCEYKWDSEYCVRCGNPSERR